jgi:uncharacterized protein (DUF362 family)
MSEKSGIIWSAPAEPLYDTLEPLLDAAGLIDTLSSHSTVLIKPNLVEALDPPITTPVGIIEALVDYLQASLPSLDIIVGEGTGSLQYDTFHCFERLGFMGLAQREGVELLDLNEEPSRHLSDESCTRWPVMYLPELLFDTFLLSVPVLKAHSLSKVTITMKNMMGCAPPAHFRGGGGWGKASFHRQIEEAIFDLNRYRTPDFTLLDGSIGMAQAHLWGPHCSPPVNRICASYDPVAIDAYGTELLGRSWKDIGHIRQAHRLLGIAEPLDVRETALVENQ